jgi:hypothetical protein
MVAPLAGRLPASIDPQRTEAVHRNRMHEQLQQVREADRDASGRAVT